MIERGKTYLVMGLLDPDSIAYAVGTAIERHGGKVVYSVQNELLKKRYLDSNKRVSAAVLFLLGPYSRMITGQVLAVDGGASIIGGQLLEHEKSRPTAI